MYPPRPKHRIRPEELNLYERKGGWVAQRKFDGTRTLIHIKNGIVEAWRPGKEKHLQWSLTKEISNQFLSLNIEKEKEYWLDGELLNNKTSTPSYKNKIVLFDILQAGRYLFNTPNLSGRQKMLFDICKNPVIREEGYGIALRVAENIWLAETFLSNFSDRYLDFIKLDEIEGLVLKREKSVLDSFGNEEYDVDWQLRCRKPAKNYSF